MRGGDSCSLSLRHAATSNLRESRRRTLESAEIVRLHPVKSMIVQTIFSPLLYIRTGSNWGHNAVRVMRFVWFPTFRLFCITFDVGFIYILC